MKKLLFAFILFVLLTFLNSKTVLAQTTCPPAQPNRVCASSNPDSSTCAAYGTCQGGVLYCCTNPVSTGNNSSCTPPQGQCADIIGDTSAFLPCCPGSICAAEPNGAFSICQSQSNGSTGNSNTPILDAIDPRASIFSQQVVCRDGNGVKTAIGCIPINQDEFLGFILGWAIGIGGGTAFLLILYAGFIIMTSTGNPERLKGGQQLLTSAISGLILLVFSAFILRIIGVNILGIF